MTMKADVLGAHATHARLGRGRHGIEGLGDRSTSRPGACPRCAIAIRPGAIVYQKILYIQEIGVISET